MKPNKQQMDNASYFYNEKLNGFINKADRVYWPLVNSNSKAAWESAKNLAWSFMFQL